MKDIILKEIVDNTKKLIEFKTIKENYTEFDAAFDYIKKELKEYYIKEIYIDNYKNIIISNTVDKNLDIIFCGHIDVVPADNYIAKEENGKLMGRGSFDMKGQLSVIISLLKNNKSNKKTAFIITSDEEIGGNCCQQIMANYNSTLAIIPDGGKNFELVIEEKGLLQLEISVKGKTYHASEPYKGENAILKLIDLYNKITNIYSGASEENYVTSVNLSKIDGGEAVNMVPGHAKMTLDIRFTKEETVNSIINNIKSLSNDIEIKVLDSGPTFHTDINLDIIKEFIEKSEEVLNDKIKIKKCTATSDAIYFSEKNIPTILINPKGNYWHAPNEYVEIDSLYTLYEIFKKMI